MYPAEELGGSISFADLPDLLVTQFVGEQFEKRGSPLTYAVGNESFTAYYGGEGFAIGIRASDPTNWTLQVDFGFGTNQGCLISQLIQDGPPDWVYDDFADTYTVTHNTGSGTVSRTSLCVWEGEDNNGCPLYLEYRDEEPFAFQWVLNWTVFIDGIGCESVEAGPKESPQNSPVGTYTDPFASSTATVSE
jgi:hypothetical protein